MDATPSGRRFSPFAWFRNLPVRFKLLVTYSSLFVVAVLSGRIIILTMMQNIIEDTVHRERTNSTALMANLVKSTANASVTNYLRSVAEKNHDIVSALYQRFRSGELPEAEAKKQAEQILLSQTVGKTGYIYALNSRGVLDVHPKLRGTDISGYAFVQEQIARRTGYLEYNWQNPGESVERPKALYMTYFAPWDWIISASSYREEFAALVNVDDLRQSILSNNYGVTGYPYVIDMSGAFVVDPRQPGEHLLGLQDTSGRLVTRSIIARRSGEIRYTYQAPGENVQRTRLVIFEHVPEFDWIVVSSSDLDAFYAPMAFIQFVLVAVMIGSLAIVLPLTFWVSDVITRPLIDLNRIFAGGSSNLSTRMPVQSRDEIGQMAAHFNGFMDKLESAHHDLHAEIAMREQAETELERHQQHLEDLVHDRTNALDEARRYVESILQTSPVAIVVVDRGNRVTTWNPAAERLFGYPAAEALGRDVDSLVTGGDVQPFPALGVDGSGLHVATRRLRKDGSQVDVDLRSVAITQNGKEIAWLAIYYDITELQQARIAAEAATRAKSEFLANMSHEIRTPMNGVIGMTSLLLDTALNGEQREYAETIRRSGEALLTIINDILDFSKIEAGKLELERHPFDLRGCVESALDLVAFNASEKGLELLANIELDVPAVVVGDVTRLRQILANLVGNAVKFTESGEIEISVRRAPPAEGAPPQTAQIAFAVRDTGIGLPPERRDRLFKSFSQVDASTTRRFGGTGLGLAICKHLVELMGGQITVESSGVPGEGSTFRFSLPLQAPDSATLAPRRSSHIALADKRLLVVDDNATNLLIVNRMARSWGMSTVDCPSARDALGRLAGGLQVDAAVLDVQMPEMDGIMLATELARNSAPGLPLIIVSSLGQKPEMPADVGVVAYLHKPLKPSVLHDALVSAFAEQLTAVEAPADPGFDAQMGQRHPLRILLAEDHLVNQKVMRLMLERLGYRADIAANGLEVIQSLGRQDYDIVLMDVQMPEMNGVEATHRLRADLPPERLPRIVALTANALGGDREEYLAAGMDGYLSKPVSVGELRAALEKCMPLGSLQRPEQPDRAGAPKPSASAAAPASATVGGIDEAVLKEYFPYEGDDAQILVSLAADFFADTEHRLGLLRAHLQRGDVVALTQEAHAVKGASRTFGAVRLSDLCQALEMLGRKGGLDGAPELCAQIDDEYRRARAGLEELVNRITL